MSSKRPCKDIRYMAKHRIVINFSKLYAMKTSSGNEKKKYGITLQALAIECTNKTVPKYGPCVVLFDDDDSSKRLTKYFIEAILIHVE